MGRTPLMFATFYDRADIVSYLLEKNANISIADKFGYNAIHYAISGKASKNTLAVLLKHNSTSELLNCRSIGTLQSPLHIAANTSYVEGASMLLNTGNVDLALRDVGGDFALHGAVKQSSLELVKLLVSEKTANKDVFRREDGVGLTVVDCAILKCEQYILGRMQPGETEVHKRRVQIKDYLIQILGFERKFASTEDIRNVTEVVKPI